MNLEEDAVVGTDRCDPACYSKQTAKQKQFSGYWCQQGWACGGEEGWEEREMLFVPKPNSALPSCRSRLLSCVWDDKGELG